MSNFQFPPSLKGIRFCAIRPASYTALIQESLAAHGFESVSDNEWDASVLGMAASFTSEKGRPGFSCRAINSKTVGQILTLDASTEFCESVLRNILQDDGLMEHVIVMANRSFLVKLADSLARLCGVELLQSTAEIFGEKLAVITVDVENGKLNPLSPNAGEEITAFGFVTWDNLPKRQ